VKEVTGVSLIYAGTPPLVLLGLHIFSLIRKSPDYILYYIVYLNSPDGCVGHLFDLQVGPWELGPSAAPFMWEGQGLVLAFAEHL